MIQLEKEFDLDDIYEKLLEQGNDLLKQSEIKLKCIGIQEKIILFVFNAYGSNCLATKFGYFCLESSEATLIYTHTDAIDVLVGSLNDEKNLLVFARKKHAKSSTYNSYLVELNNTKVFDLAIENPHTQYLLFFPWNYAKQQGTRREHLIFFLEKRRLGIIHVTTTLNKSDKLEVQQIQKEYLVQHYIWFQIDIAAMRLYFIYLQQKSCGGEVKTSSSMFNVYQFSSKSNPEIILSVSLPLPLHSQLYSVSKRFMVGATSCFLPDHRVTMTVLTPPSNTECLVLCVGFNSSYYLYLVHSGYLVECHHGSQNDVMTQGIVFVDVAGYVMVYSPPTVLHFIDASSEHDMKRNMVMEDVPLPLPFRADQQDFMQWPGKVMPLCPITIDSGYKSIMIKQKTIYRVLPDPAGLLSAFQASNCPTTWSFLLHVALSHLKDMALGHKMLLHCITVDSSIYLRELLKEFILASTHLKLSLQEDITTDILNTIPYTNEDSQIPVLERSRVLKVSNIFQTITKPMISSQKFQLVVSHVGHFMRFNLEDFVSKCCNTPGSGGDCSLSTTSSPSCGLTRSNHSSSDDMSSYVSSPPGSDDDSLSLSDTLTSALQYHIRQRFDEMIPLRACQDAAKMYFNILAQQGRVVMSLILMSVGKVPTWCPEKEDLVYSDSPEPGLSDLLRMLDVFKYAMIQLGNQFPAKFDWLHVYTAYKTLPMELFLRRLSDRSIKVTSTTVHKFLISLPSDCNSQVICSTLISTLSRSAALQALKDWDSTKYRQFTAQNYLVSLKKKVGLSGPVEPERETPPYLRSHPFIPVNSFYSYLYHKLPNVDVCRKLQVLSESSMEHTRTKESDETLRGVTFY